MAWECKRCRETVSMLGYHKVAKLFRLAIFCWHQAPYYNHPFTWMLKETPHGDSTVSQILFRLRSVKAFRATTTFRQHARGHLILASDSVSVSSYPRESACIIVLVNEDLHVNKHYTREVTVHPDNHRAPILI